MTDEMLDLANANKAKAGAANVEFLKGTIENVPLSDGAVDVVISNCVINLSTDKPAVLAEMFRVLVPGGRIGVSDVVAEDHLTPADRAERGSYVGCIAGALSRSEYMEGLAAVGFVDAEVAFTHLSFLPSWPARRLRAWMPTRAVISPATRWEWSTSPSPTAASMPPSRQPASRLAAITWLSAPRPAIRTTRFSTPKRPVPWK